MDHISETYLLAHRRPALWGRTAPLLSADQPRGFRLLKIFKEAYETKDPARSAQLFAENDVDLVLVTDRERAPHMNPEKFKDGDHFRLAFDNGWAQVYQVGSDASIPQQSTLTAQAKRAREAGNFDKARKLYEEAAAVESDPGVRKDILMEWAITERANDPEKAASLFEEAAAEADPGARKDILIEWAITERANDPEKAASLFEQVLVLDPGHGEARVNYGMVLLNLERIDEAIEVLTALVADAPNHHWGWRLLGGAYEKQGAWEKAQDAYQHAADAARPGSKDQSVMVVGILRSAVRGGQCEQAEEIAQLYAELLSAQSEEIAPLLAECQK